MVGMCSSLEMELEMMALDEGKGLKPVERDGAEKEDVGGLGGGKFDGGGGKFEDGGGKFEGL